MCRLTLLPLLLCLSPAAARPNVLFLFSDDQRFDTIAALGNKDVRTPHLDRLVARGFTFTHAFCMGSTQPAVCVPSRAMMLTGRSLFRTAARIPANQPMWPEVLRQAGYTTFGVGKWHNNPPAFNRCFARGENLFFGGMKDHNQIDVQDHDPSGKYPKARSKIGPKFSTELFADSAVRFLKGHKKGTPFVAYVAFTAPHDPRTPPAEYASLYDAERLPLPASYLPEHPFDNGELKVRDEKLAGWPRTEAVVRRHTADYYGMISHLDAQVGRVLDALKESGHADDTLIVFAADNGLAVGRHGLLGKQNLYDHSVRVPLVLAGPGIPAGKKSDALVYLFDLFPTLCELTGVDVPRGVEGKSLVGVMKGDRERVRDVVFGAYRDVQRMARTDRWKLIRYPRVDRTQLFDLKADPDEVKDLAGSKEHAGKLEEMTALLARLQKEHNDPQALESADWKPASGPLTTRWAKDVRPDRVHPEYPRPQLVRKDWLTLNGLWDYAVRPGKDDRPEKYDGKLLVPFPIESALSGVMQRIKDGERLWYRRTFTRPEGWAGKRLLLHFGAVDWQCEAWVNGKKVGEHKGGYDPFTFDITDALRDRGVQEIVVGVVDPSDAGPQPRGKQVRRPRGIWYTPTTGIWQTVWLEPVHEKHIRRLKITPDVDNSAVRVQVIGQGEQAVFLTVTSVSSGDDKPPFKQIIETGKTGPEIVVKVPEPRLWSPVTPWLYDLKVDLVADGKPVDTVTSYFGLRKISLGREGTGSPRILLNDKPLFQYGPLDQGFWPDGLYTAPTDAALRYDLELTQQLGFNMVRKHVKVEPARWYHHCDRMGLLVWQDMPSGDRNAPPGEKGLARTPESAAVYEAELTAMLDHLHNHPSIVVWVPFNEGWGQFDTKRITELVKKRDPSRLVDCASGWHDLAGVGDMHDIHVYPGPGVPRPEAARALVLGEFGGLGLPLKGHTWQDEKNWGYRTFKTPEELTDAYVQLVAALRPLIGKGLSAAVYTQTTDVEIEVNGLLSYDRAVIKMDAKRITEANRKLYLPPPVVAAVVPTSQEKGIEWRYTTTKPADGWEKPDFDDSGWKKGPGGFGRKETPGAVVRTDWQSPDIWLRRTVELPERMSGELYLLVHHDEDVEVYANGTLVLKRTGYTTDYMLLPLTESARKALRAGTNTLAVHCKQTGGGQYIDVGLVSVRERDGK